MFSISLPSLLLCLTCSLKLGQNLAWLSLKVWCIPRRIHSLRWAFFCILRPILLLKNQRKKDVSFLRFVAINAYIIFLINKPAPTSFQGRPTTLVPDQARPKLVQRLVSSLARTILSKQSKFEEFETFFKVQGFLSLNSVGAEKFLTTPSSVIVRSTNPIWAGKWTISGQTLLHDFTLWVGKEEAMSADATRCKVERSSMKRRLNPQIVTISFCQDLENLKIPLLPTNSNIRPEIGLSNRKCFAMRGRDS